MDMPKNGESSRSPHVADGVSPSATSGAMPQLILPEWDPVPPKHLHSSMDLISLLNLGGLYNTYVRPYFDPVPETDDEGGPPPKPRARKRQGLSKGYVGLIEDCIEHSLLPLLNGEAPEGPITLLSSDLLANARLEPGLKTEGYAGGEKAGVREAEERRKRKKARLSQSVQPEFPDIAAPDGTPATPGIPAPAPPARGRTPFTVGGRGRGGHPGSGSRPPWPRASAPPGAGGRYAPGSGMGTPGTPTPRPGNRQTPGTPSGMTLKRHSDGPYPPGVKRARAMGGSGSRSASPAGTDVGVKAVFKRRTDEI